MATTTIAEFMGHDHDRLDEIFNQFHTIRKQDSQKARVLFQELFNRTAPTYHVGRGDSFSGL